MESQVATPVLPEVTDAEEQAAGDAVAGYAAQVLEHVRPEWAYSIRVRRILDRAHAMLRAGQAVDLVSLCEGQSKEFVLYTSTVINHSHGGRNVRSIGRVMRNDWRRRETARIGLELADGVSGDPQRVSALVAQLSRMADSDGTDSPRIANLARSGQSLVEGDVAPLVPLLGQRIMVEGGMSLVVGHSGLGKTFFALQLMRAIAEGTEFLEAFWTDPDGRRVGLLELEMPEASIKERIERIPGRWLEDASFLCMPDFPVDLVRHEIQDELITWIRRERLAMVVLDPVNSLHALDENKAGDMALFMGACKRIRAKTGAHLLLLHHANKSQQDIKTTEATPRTAVLQMVRGSGRLGNDPDNIIGLLESPGERVRLVFAKTRHGESPQSLYLKRTDTGYFERAEAIQAERASESAEKIEKYLLTRHTPATLSEIARAVRMSESGVKKRLVSMEQNVTCDDGRPRRYAIRTSALIDQCVLPTESGTSSWDNQF